MDPQAIYVNLGRLAEQIPDFDEIEELRPSDHIWLSKVHALILELGSKNDAVKFQQAWHSIDKGLNRRNHILWIDCENGKKIVLSLLYASLAIAELKAPDAVQGAFIPVGNAFDAMVGVGKALSPAKGDVLIVDPYMDEKALTDFALLAATGVRIRLLADNKHYKQTLAPAAQRWIAQYGGDRPLEVRLAPDRTLHDRVIITDESTVWVLTQSLKDFAARSPATIVRSEGDAAILKIDAYKGMWATATPI